MSYKLARDVHLPQVLLAAPRLAVVWWSRVSSSVIWNKWHEKCSKSLLVNNDVGLYGYTWLFMVILYILSNILVIGTVYDGTSVLNQPV